MWLALANRLREGEVLYQNSQFEHVLLQIYELVTGQTASDSVHREIEEMVTSVNRDHPETYLAHGVQNGIAKAFEEGVRRQNWDVAKIQSKGARALKRFSQQDTVRDMLEDANLSPSQISVVECVQHVIEQVAPRQDQPRTAQPQAPSFRPDLAPPAAPPAPEPTADKGPAIDPEAEAAVAALDPGRSERAV